MSKLYDENLRPPFAWWLPEAEALGYDTSAIREHLPPPEPGTIWLYWEWLWDVNGNWIGPDVEPELIAFLTHKRDTDYPIAAAS